VVVGRFDAAQVAELREVVPRAKFVRVESADEAMKHIADAEVLIGILSQDLVRAGKKLKWVQVLSAGVDRYRYAELVESDVVLTNGKVIQGANVGDQAMALLLTLTRRIQYAVRQKSWENRRDWYADEGGAIELEGKKALVVGLGGIGTAIARRCYGFGMTVTGVDIDLEKGDRDFVEAIHPPEKLDELLPEADVVVLAVPLTPKTHGMMGTEQFAAMKKGSYLVNIARGKVIDTNALVEAIKAGTFGGVGLDVTDPEPLPSDHVLWTFPNVVITPHVGGASDQLVHRRLALVKENLRRFVAGEPLRNVVDKKKGY
jgi:phosphoglycerate dehydrogenase-like enzyme